MGAGCLKRPLLANFLKNTAFGVFIGFELAILAAWAFDAQINSAPQLLTASSALVGAFLAVAGVLSNIDNQNQISEGQRERSLLAAKATLPLTLTSMIEIAVRGAHFTVSGSLTEQEAEQRVLELTLPTEVISSLQKVIEYSSDDDAAKLSYLISYFQILQSRTKRWLIEDYAPLNINEGLAVRWAFLVRQIENCFDYARNDDASIPSDLRPLKIREFFSVRLREDQTTISQLMPEISHLESCYDPTRKPSP